jgi:hypothetical protein
MGGFIAATAQTHQLTLVTRNLSDFSPLKTALSLDLEAAQLALRARRGSFRIRPAEAELHNPVPVADLAGLGWRKLPLARRFKRNA